MTWPFTAKMFKNSPTGIYDLNKFPGETSDPIAKGAVASLQGGWEESLRGRGGRRGCSVAGCRGWVPIRGKGNGKKGRRKMDLKSRGRPCSLGHVTCELHKKSTAVKHSVNAWIHSGLLLRVSFNQLWNLIVCPTCLSAGLRFVKQQRPPSGSRAWWSPRLHFNFDGDIGCGARRIDHLCVDYLCHTQIDLPFSSTIIAITVYVWVLSNSNYWVSCGNWLCVCQNIVGCHLPAPLPSRIQDRRLWWQSGG